MLHALLTILVAQTPAPDAAATPAPAATEAAPAATAPAATPEPTASASTTTSAPAATVSLVPPRKDGWATDFGGSSFEFRLNAAARLAQSAATTTVLDDLGTTAQTYPFETRLRLAPELSFKGFSLVSEFDVLTGAVVGTPDSTIVAARQPTPTWHAADLRQLYAQFKWSSGAVRIGQQTSQFGLGMLANSGSKDSEPGDFGMQHGGTVALRALIAGRPFLGSSELLSALEGYAAFDLVVRDGTADLLQGDRAFNGIVGVRFNVDEKNVIGLTLIYRNQRRPNGAPDERSTDAFVADLSGRWTLFSEGRTALDVGGELAAITGKTTQGRSDTAPVLDVRQLGMVGKVNYRNGRWSLLVDGGYASGDQNPYDTTNNAFRFDRDYKVGLVLFDQVVGYQSARTAWRASDPNLAGVAPEGVDLLPTGGAVTGAWYLFPRARLQATEWLDVYGGPMFAFASAQPVDVFTTRINGGTPINSLGARPGNYLGTEIDLGFSLKFQPAKYLKVSTVFEGGLLLPGDAFKNAAGAVMPPVALGRVRLNIAL
ncbi:MAG: hypothetical protein U0228_20965 [Myxococcaceae bacterium]